MAMQDPDPSQSAGPAFTSPTLRYAYQAAICLYRFEFVGVMDVADAAAGMAQAIRDANTYPMHLVLVNHATGVPLPDGVREYIKAKVLPHTLGIGIRRMAVVIPEVTTGRTETLAFLRLIPTLTNYELEPFFTEADAMQWLGETPE